MHRRTWSDSFNDQNFFPVDVGVRPIWELVQGVNKTKGDELRRVLLAKWEAETGAWAPTCFFTEGCTDPDAHNYDRCADISGKDDGSCVYKHISEDCNWSQCRDQDSSSNNCRVVAATSQHRHASSGVPTCSADTYGHEYEPVCARNIAKTFWVDSQQYHCCKVVYTSNPPGSRELFETTTVGGTNLCPWRHWH